jgi:hypothetical protein
MLGRVQLDSLTQEQQAALLGPSPAARILDLLLSLPGSSDRLALLPDCFTAPEAVEGDEAAAGGDEETDELWCTPMQLLNEIDRRLNAAAAAAAAAAGADSQASSSSAGALPSGGGSSGSAAAALPAAGASQGTVYAGMPGDGPEDAVVLRELRQHIQGQWLESLPQV